LSHVGHWQPDGEGAALAYLAYDRKAAAMLFDNLPRAPQTQADPAGARRDIRRPVEAFKYSW
jgi:hypothetical protein